MSTMTERRSLMDEMKVDLPEGEFGSCEIRKFTVERDSLQNMMLGARYCQPGEYTRLDRNGRLWMSDTTAERSDHLGAAWEIERRGGRVLVGGLGLGCILRPAIFTPEVTHIDVVEIDPDVIGLVGPHYEKLAAEHGKTITIHNDDLYEKKWPTGTHWNVAWFDIWADLCEDNLESMGKLNRSYARRTDWKGCWGQELLKAQRRRTANAWWR